MKVKHVCSKRPQVAGGKHGLVMSPILKSRFGFWKPNHVRVQSKPCKTWSGPYQYIWTACQYSQHANWQQLTCLNWGQMGANIRRSPVWPCFAHAIWYQSACSKCALIAGSLDVLIPTAPGITRVLFNLYMIKYKPSFWIWLRIKVHINLLPFELLATGTFNLYNKKWKSMSNQHVWPA